MKMKRYIIPFLTLAAVLSGCAVDELNSSLKDIKVEPSYVTLKPEGDSKEITLTATGNWTITNIPEWLTVEPASGSATEGQTVKLTALKAYEDLSVELHANVGASTQIILVKQSLGENLEVTTVKDFMESGVNGKVYNIQGIAGAIENTLYGNFYINDGTYEDGPGAYVYGMLDANGAEKNFLSLGIEEGDEIIISGPRLVYGGKVEIENATLVKMVKKALLGADVKAYTIEKEAGNLAAPIVVKGNDARVSVPSEIDWVKFEGVEGSGEKTKILLSYSENTTALPREAEVTVTSSKEIDGAMQSSSLTLSIKQLPAYPEVKAASEIDYSGKEYVSVEGKIAAMTTDGFILDDGTSNGVNKVFVEVADFNYREFKVGYKMKAVGYAEKKYARNKVVADIVENVEKSEGYTYPEAIVLDKENASDVLSENPAEYGYYKVSGFVSSDKNILIPDASQAVSAISPIGDVELNDFVGGYVVTYGYYTDNNSSKGLIQLVLVKVEQGSGEPDFFKLPSTDDELSWDETSSEFQVLTNKSWTASLPEGTEGVSLSKTSGNGSDEIEVSFAGKNNSYDEEKVVVTVSDGTENLTYTVTRTGKVLKLSADSELITKDAQKVTVSVAASLFWKATVDGGATLDKSEGKGTDAIVVSVPENAGKERRSFTITLTEDRVTEEKSVTLVLTQRSADEVEVVYKETNTVSSGSKYLIYAGGGAMKLLSGETHGYPEAQKMEVSDGEVVTFDSSCEFTFVSDGNGFNIVSADGKYIYMTGSYDSLNWSETKPESGAVWTVEAQADGTVKILNEEKSKYIQYATKYSSFGSYNYEKGELPKLYVRQ